MKTSTGFRYHLGLLLLLGLFSFFFSHVETAALEPEDYLNRENEKLRRQINLLTTAQWELASNITAENEAKVIEQGKTFDAFRKGQYEEIAADYDFTRFPEYIRRQFEKLALIGTAALPSEEAARFQEVQLAMEAVYSTATVQMEDLEGGSSKLANLSLEPGLTKVFSESTNETRLREAWLKWRDATGPKMRTDFITYYQIGNKAAKANKLKGKTFQTLDDLWMSSWETADMKEQVDELMEELMPLYAKIHAYVRHHLTRKYGPEVMPVDGTIPAHLLGNMWAQQWSNVLNTVTELNPHPEVVPIDSEVNRKLKNWTVLQMFQLSERFFHDLGMANMTRSFYRKSILEKPTDRNLTCHASAWDFYEATKTDYRIKQCTERTFNDLVTVHHEMGHIQYYMNYADQPTAYREGANPGFHEAIGDLIALSVSSPEHLEKVGLLERTSNEELRQKVNLNYQLKMALEKIVFLPFAYVLDRWRWDVFAAEGGLDHALNRHWWTLRLRHQGLSPPVKRSERDFDPGAKYHIPAGVEYVRYFASHVLQFQFFEHMCGFVEPKGTGSGGKPSSWGDSLYKCDFDGNKLAGASLRAMLAKGSSASWQSILKDFIGSERMSLGALRRYFTPLESFLDGFISRHNLTVGWADAK
ncbi:PREDICTED: angiotensin-converting enzyme-like, partial [Rhagoletis zephyria]|uniref:angiotensin-converting enzyme-like n=1 Tax=Rhagoletis zephyria TaxID=28612 RepID=UPI00081180A8